MLKQIRENARIPLYLLIIAFIGLYAISSHDTSPVAGKIFGKKVALSDYKKAYIGARTQMIMRYGELPRDAQAGTALEEESWDRLILLREAKKERIKTDDKEVVDFVKGINVFNDKNGKFSNRLYEEILRYNFGLTPKEFEDIVRENLIIKKLVDEQSRNITVSDEDVLKEYKLLNEKAKADYILVKIVDYLPQAPAGEDEVKAYFEKNRDLFKIPEQVNIEYIGKAFPDDKQETKEKIRKEMKDVSYESGDNKDLAAVAKKFSLPVKETGPFDRESNIPGIGYDLKFADTALSFDVGEVSSPIETKSGIYIFRVKEKKPARTADFAQARGKAEGALKAQKADALAKVKAQEALTEIKKDPEKFEDAVKRLSLPAKRTEEFARSQYIEGLGLAPEFANAAFSVKQGGVFGEVVKVHDGYAVVRQVSITPIDDKKYQEERDKLKETMLTRKRFFTSVTWFSELKKRANLQSNLDKAR